MNWRGLTALLLALASGALMKVGDIYQPFRLRSLCVVNGTPATEAYLQSWGESFASCSVLWRFHWHELDQWQNSLPLRLTVHSDAWKGRLRIVVESLEPAVELSWQGKRIFLALDGHIWTKDLADQYMLEEPPKLPVLKLEHSFPITVLSADGTLDGLAQSDLPASWVLNLLKTLDAQSSLTADDVTLRRRGGEDVVQCHLTEETSGRGLKFIGLADRLDRSLSVARQLLISGQTKNYGLLDATYQDKIILRQAEAEH